MWTIILPVALVVIVTDKGVGNHQRNDDSDEIKWVNRDRGLTAKRKSVHGFACE